MEELLQLTKNVWETYLGSDVEKVAGLLDMIDENVTVIGTGKREIYHNREEFAHGLTAEFSERDGLCFELRNYRSSQQKLTDDVYIVYGEALVYWEAEDQSVCVNLDSRFTIVYKKCENKWMIMHLHQSLPNLEQMGDEAYPKTMTEQVEKANQEITELSDLVSKDALTGLYNKRFLEQYCKENKLKAWLFMIDIDDFKNINDFYGHLVGDDALRKTANILDQAITGKGIACRIGGDEFLLLGYDLVSEEDAKKLANSLFERFASENWGDYLFTGVSVGYGLMDETDSLEEAIKRVDKALYEAKREGKNRYCEAK